MYPVLFHIGSYSVRAYSLAIFLALICAASLSAWVAKRRGQPWAAEYHDFMTWALIGGILGARLWEVAFNWAYFRTVPHQVFAVWEGGLSIQGAVLGGLTAALLFTRAKRIPAGRFLDGVVPGLLLGQAIGRLLGCTLNGDAFGKPTGTGFGIIHAPGTIAYEIYGSQPLWPAEVFEGLFDLALLGLFLRLGVNRGPGGNHFLLYGLLYSAGRFGLEFLRADTGPVMWGLSAAQLGSLAVILLCGGWLLRRPALAYQADAKSRTP